MPVNDYGVRADIIKAPEAVFNRMIMSPVYEQFLNCTSEVVIRNMKKYVNEENNYDKAYDYLVEYISDVNPLYANVIRKQCDTPKRKHSLVYITLKKEMIILVTPPFLNTITPEWVLMMRDKYKIQATPVEYNLIDADGKVIRRVRTIRDIWIGKTYNYMLCKIPYARSCGMSHVNQWHTPIRIKSQKSKSQYPVGLTPIRIGEDENRNLMMVVGNNIAFRILSLYANTPEATDKLTEDLLTLEHPTRLSWVDFTEQQLKNNNKMIAVMKHMLRTIGVDMDDSIIKEYEKSEFEIENEPEEPKKRKRRTKQEMKEYQEELNRLKEQLEQENKSSSLHD